MLLMITALMLVLATLALLYFTTKEKSLRNSLLISVGIHAALFIKFFSVAESFSIPARYDAIDFTFIPAFTENTSQNLPHLTKTISVTDGVKLFGGEINSRRRDPVDKKLDNQNPGKQFAKTADKNLPSLKNIKWFDFINDGS